MAMRHRKLFPTSTTNQTVDCSEICDQTCPYGCYPYPDFYWGPPPPPPPPSANKGHHVSPYVIIIVTLLASFLLLISYYAIIMKYCSRRTRVRAPPIQSDGPDEEFLDENRGPTIDHPIWYITTVGLQSSVINSITVFKYKKDDNLIEGTDCSVCLNEFKEDETLRLLPKCNHAFHIPCIDTWLRSHTNCPLCRAGIVSNNLVTPLGSNQQNFNGLGSNEETHMEISENENELETNQGRAETGDCGNRAETGDCGNRAQTGDEVDFQQIVDETKEIENPKKDMTLNGNFGFWVVDDSADNDMVVEDEIQPVRRSVSMNSAAALSSSLESEGSSVNPRVDVEGYDFTKKHIENSRILGMMGGSSISQSLHKGPVSMKRSFSYGGRSFLSRHYRSENTILPL